MSLSVTRRAALLGAFAAVPAFALSGLLRAPAALAADREELDRIEEYLNGIRTVQARFLQLASTGEVAEGTVYLKRPGHMRIEYVPPTPILIIANGRFLIYYDKKLEQVSYLPLGSTPAGILLKDTISLQNSELRVTALESDSAAVRLSLVRTENPGEGSLTLVFSDQPLTLRQWQVTDSQGVMTTVSLQDARFGVPLKNDLFEFRDPNFFRERFQ